MRFEYSVPSLAGLDDDLDEMLEDHPVFKQDGLRGMNAVGAASLKDVFGEQMTSPGASRLTAAAAAALKSVGVPATEREVEQVNNPVSSSKVPLIVAGIGVLALAAVLLMKKKGS